MQRSAGMQTLDLESEKGHFLAVCKERLLSHDMRLLGPAAHGTASRIRKEMEQDPDRIPSPLSITVADHSFTDQALAALALDCLRQIPHESLSPSAQRLIQNDVGRKNGRLANSRTRQRLMRLVEQQD